MISSRPTNQPGSKLVAESPPPCGLSKPTLDWAAVVQRGAQTLPWVSSCSGWRWVGPLLHWILTEIMMKSKYVDMLEEAGRCVQRIGLCKCGQCPCLASPQGLHCLKPPSHFHYTCNNKNGNQFMSPTMTLTLQYWLLNCDNKMFLPALQFALRDENGWSLIKSKHIRCPVFASIVFF